jgi:hypothetical protein
MEHPRPVFSHFGRDQVSHPCKTTGKIKFCIFQFLCSSIPRWYPYFDTVLRHACSKDPGNCAGSSIAGRSIHTRQVKGDDPDEKGCSGPPGWGLDVRLTSPHEKLMLRKTQRVLINRRQSGL